MTMGLVASNVTGVNGSAHLGDFLKLAAIALGMFALMLMLVRFAATPAGTEKEDPENPAASSQPGHPPLADRAAVGLARTLGLLGNALIVAGAVLYFAASSRWLGTAVLGAGVVSWTAGRFQRQSSAKRKVAEAASASLLIPILVLPPGFSFPLLICAAAVLVVGSRH